MSGVHGRVASLASGRRTTSNPEAIERLVQLREAVDKMYEGAKSRKELEGTEKPRDGFQIIKLPT